MLNVRLRSDLCEHDLCVLRAKPTAKEWWRRSQPCVTHADFNPGCKLVGSPVRLRLLIPFISHTLIVSQCVFLHPSPGFGGLRRSGSVDACHARVLRHAVPSFLSYS